jgi:predicted small secreted protein
MDERETLKRSNALTLILLAIALVSSGCTTVGRFSDAASQGATQDNRVIRHASRSVVPVLVARLGLPAPRSSAVIK